MSHTERRAQPRLAYQGKAYLTFDGRCRTEDVVDVSGGGLFLKTSARLKPGAAVKVFLPLHLGGAWRLCLLKGDVVRRTRGRSGGLAIALRPGETDTRALLADFVSVA
jgi:hypothetical protein